MYKITHKKTGFIHYFNSKETANFVNANGSKNYKVEEVRTLNKSEIFYAFLTLTLKIFSTASFICFLFESIATLKVTWLYSEIIDDFSVTTGWSNVL